MAVTTTQPIVTEEMAMLYQRAYKLPFDKAKQLLGYEPIVSFADACQRSIAWLTFAGYSIMSDQFKS